MASKVLALTLLVPCSYFCIFWNVIPTAWPSAAYDTPSRARRARIRSPICASVSSARPLEQKAGLGLFPVLA